MFLHSLIHRWLTELVALEMGCETGLEIHEKSTSLLSVSVFQILCRIISTLQSQRYWVVQILIRCRERLS